MGSAARELSAAASALAAYLTTVLPRVRRELKQVGPLPEEKARNAEAVAVFATLAPREHRVTVVRAIVALQVAIDLRDEAEEAGRGDDPGVIGRIARLDECWRDEVRALPAYKSVRRFLDEAVERCEHGQIQTHRAAREGSTELQAWAADLSSLSGFRWWEFAAGASSSVAAHALIAAAADPATSPDDAAQVDDAYFPSTSALTVLLDDLVDRKEDRAAGEHSYLAYYRDAEEAASQLEAMARHARLRLETLPRADRHRAILAGVAAYYLSSPQTETEYAAPIRARLLEASGPGTRLLARFASLRRFIARKWPGRAGNSPEP